jgi:hypothetical protein
MEIMNHQVHGESVPGQIKIQPVLMTRENLDSVEIRKIENMSWWTPQ